MFAHVSEPCTPPNPVPLKCSASKYTHESCPSTKLFLNSTPSMLLAGSLNRRSDGFAGAVYFGDELVDVKTSSLYSFYRQRVPTS